MADAIITVDADYTPANRATKLFYNDLKKFGNSQPLGRITGHANEFQKSLEASNARVVAFGASAGSIFALRAAFEKLVTSTVEVEKSLTDINNLLNLSRGDLSRFSADLFKVANATGQTFSDAAKAAQEFSRQGLGVEATLQRTSSALILTRLSGLALEDSVSSLTAALNNFGKEALTDVEIVNRLANVDAKFAVSSKDLAEALKRVSSSASDAGVEFNQIISLVTAAQQTTARGGAVIGNSFKTIFTRLQRPQVLDDLEAAGVAVRDLNGKSVGTIQILKNLSTAYSTLSSSQKSFVAETVGGVYQINVLKSILHDLGGGFSVYQGALDAAGESTATAQKRIEALNNTIASQFIRTLNNLTEASSGIGNVVLAPTIRGGAAAIDNILKVQKSINQVTGGSEEHGAGSAAFAAVGKGIGNVIAGPGVQLAIYGIIKLFVKLIEFVASSYRDISGLNDKAKERAAIEAVVLRYFGEQKDALANLVSGQTKLSEIHDQILGKLREEAKIMQYSAVFVPAIAQELKSSGVGFQKKGKAAGHVPSLTAGEAYSEMLGAKRGGYSAGVVVGTSIRDGSTSIPAVVNGAETKSAVVVGGKTYEFVNPPKNSMAGILHWQKSLSQTGIDPYKLKQGGVFAGGHVPNLTMADNVNTIKSNLHQMLTFKEIAKQAKIFVSTTPDVQKKGGSAFDREYLIAALTNKALNGSAGENDLKVIQKTMGINGSYFDVLSQGFEQKLNLVELKKRVKLGEFASGFVPNLARIPVYHGTLAKEDFSVFRKGDIGFHGGTKEQAGERIRDILSYGARILPLTFDLKNPARIKDVGDFDSPYMVLSQLLKDKVIDRNEFRSFYENKKFRNILAAGASGKGKYKDFASIRKLLRKKGYDGLVYKNYNEGIGEDSYVAFYPNQIKSLYNINPNSKSRDIGKSLGFIPNLSVEAERVNSEEVLRTAKLALNNAHSGDGDTFEAQWRSKPREEFMNKGAVSQTVNGIFRSKLFDGRYKDRSTFNTTAAGQAVVQSLLGIFRIQQVADKAKSSNLDPRDIQSMLSLRGNEFAGLFGFSNFADQSTLGSGNIVGNTEINEGKFTVPFRYAGLLNPKAYADVQKNQIVSGSLARKKALLAGIVGGSSDISNPGQVFGNLLDTDLVSIAKDLGIPTARQGGNLDILGYNEKFGSLFSPTGPFAGADIKTSLYQKNAKGEQGLTGAQDSIADKIARVLALKKGSGEAEVPPLLGISKFTGRNVGFLDYDYFQGGRNDFEALVYAAIAQGKPIKTNIGPTGSGKTTNAIRSGAKAVLTREDLNRYDEFILNAAGTKINSGVLGLALASSSHIQGFNPSKEKLLENIKNRANSPAVGDTRGQSELLGQIIRAESQTENEFSPVFEGLSKKFGKFGRFGFASGFISDALKRENYATRGNGILSQSKKLISSENPLGFAAIDKRSQRTADEAIIQHLAMGQSMDQIKKAGKSKGYIPNLAAGDDFASSIQFSGILALLQSFGNIDIGKEGFKGLKNSLGSVVGLFDKQARETEREINQTSSLAKKQQDWLSALEISRTKLLHDPTKPVAIKTGPEASTVGIFRTEGEINSRLAPQIKEAQAGVSTFNNLVTAQRNKIRTAGLVTSIGGGVVGGAVSSLFEKSAPDVSAGIDQFTSGLQTSGQILTAFQGKMARFTAGVVLASAVFNGIDTFSKGLGNARKAFDLSSEKTQKFVAEITGLIGTIDTLDSMVLDSSVSQGVLVKTQRKYEESLSKLASMSDEGAKLANNVRGAGSDDTRKRALLEAQDFYTKELEKQANLLQVKELGGERSIIGVGTRLSGGLFGGGTTEERNKSSQILQTSASNVISSFNTNNDPLLKEFLFNNVNKANFGQSLKNTSPEFNAIAAEIKKSGGLDEDIGLLVKQIQLFVGQQRLNEDPNVKAKRQVQIEKSENGQFDLDSAIRNQGNLRRLFANTAVIKGGNIINQSRRATQEEFDRFQISEAKTKGANRISALFSSDETGKARDISVEADRLKAEFAQKSGGINADTSSKLLSLLGKGFDDLVKNVGTTGTGEIGNPTPQLGASKTELLNALNEGLLGALKQTGGNLKGVIDKDQSGESLKDLILSNTNARPEVKNRISNEISSKLTDENFLNIITSGSEQNIELLQNLVTQSLLQVEALQSIDAEEKAKRGAESFGGLRLLTDRKFAAEQRRNIVKGQRLFDSSDEKTKGEGAALLLGARQFTGAGVDKVKDKGLLNAVATGRDAAINQFINRVVVPGGGAGAREVQRAIDERTSNSENAVDLVFKPVNAQARQGAIDKANANATSGKALLDAATESANRFPAALDNLKEKIEASAKSIGENRERIEAKNLKAGNELADAIKEAAQALNLIVTKQGEINSQMSQSGTGLKDTLKTGAIVAAIILGSKGNRESAGQFIKAVPGLFNKGVDKAASLAAPIEKKLGRFVPDFSLGGPKPTVPKITQIDPFTGKPVTTSAVNIQDINRRLGQKQALEGGFGPKTPINNILSRPLPTTKFDSAPKPPIIESYISAKHLIPQGNLALSGERGTSSGFPANIPIPASQKIPTGQLALSRLSKGGKSALITGGIVAALSLLTGQAQASEGETGLDTTKRVGGDILKNTGIGLGGNYLTSLALNKLSSGLRPGILKGSLGGIGGIKGIGASLGIGIGDELLNPLLAPQGQGNEYLRTAASFLPARLQIAARAGIRGGEAINYFGGGGKQDLDTADKNNKLSSLYGANPLLEEIRKINEYIRGDRGNQPQNITREYQQQADFLRKNSGELSDPEQMKKVFEALGERIDNLRKGIENGPLNEEQKNKLQESSAPITFPPINIEISIKDADKIPEIFNNKIIRPLEEQIRAMKDRISLTEDAVGFSPQPASL